MTTPQISIVVPVYNAENFLENCIASILNQSFKDFELILVDDGSTDHSVQICDRYASLDHRIKVLHKQNAGAASARKDGVNMAIGNWIFFSDSDDSLPHNALFDLMQVANKYKSLDIISGTFTDGPYTYRHIQTGIISPTEYICNMLQLKTHIGPWAKLIKHKLFNQFDWNTPHDIFQNEDLLMLLGLAHNANSVYIDNNLICYNFISRNGSASSRIMPYEGWEKLFFEIEKFLDLTNSNVRNAFLIYRLNALYRYLILHKNFIDINSHPYLLKFTQDWKFIKKREQDAFILKVITNKKLQKYCYYKSKIKKRAMQPLYCIMSIAKRLTTITR